MKMQLRLALLCMLTYPVSTFKKNMADNFYSYFDANTMSYFRKFLQKHQGTYIHNYISK